jgi:outer membrane protein W
MKKLLLAAVVVLFVISANAQMKIGVGGGVGLPMGDFGTSFKMGFGGGANAKKMLSENVALGLGVGYYSFTAKDEAGGSDFTMSFIPITGIFNYYFATEGFKPYAGADLGFFMTTAKVSLFGMSASTSETDFGFAPTLGFEAALGESMGLDVNAKYNYIMTAGTATSYIGINVGLVFKLGGK